MAPEINIEELILKYPELEDILREVNTLRKNSYYPPGNFYSPIIDTDDINKRRHAIWKKHPESITGIDLYSEDQIDLAQKFVAYYSELPSWDEEKTLRYKFKNVHYSYTDAITLYSFLRHFKPKKLIEVGSGYTSALILDTIDLFSLETSPFFIEPYPGRLRSLLTEGDEEKCTIIEKKLQDVEPELFRELKSGDILFIDSSHVVKTGSDVQFLFFEILPILSSGVLIHFHDIFYPFEYPEQWVMDGRNWNEAYFLRAFLAYNRNFKIRFFAHYLHLMHPEVFSPMPLSKKNTGGNIWIEKV